MLAKWDEVYKTAIPADGTKALQLTDACYLDDGQDKPYLLDLWSTDTVNVRAANTYRVGAVRSNLTVVSATPNAAGTMVRAVVKYDITYTDGTKTLQAENHLVFGNSASLCTDRGLTATGQTGTNWRFGGNGRQVSTNVQAVNRYYSYYKLSDNTSNGADKLEARLDFYISDFRDKGITYTIVTGANLPATGLKFVMPSVLRDAAEMQGKTGNFKNYTSKDIARVCSYKTTTNGVTSSYWDANLADCVTNGGGGFHWTQNDTSINNLPTNAVYTFALYNDDGWKTVNGQNGKTAVYTYTDVLAAKPFLTTQITPSNFPNVTSQNGDTLLGFAKGAGGAMTLDLSAATAPAGNKAFGYSSLSLYSQGSAATNATGVLNPMYRQSNAIYPVGNTAKTAVPITVLGKMTEMSAANYFEGRLRSTDRNGRFLEGLAVWN
jgi:hypothetical protein